MGGWHDIFGYDNVRTFELLNYEATNPACRGQWKLIMDPSGHCTAGDYG